MANCIIVDAYGPAIHLAQLLKERDYNIIHVQSTDTIPPPFIDSINSAGFIEKYFDADWNNLVTSLAKHQPKYVFAGFETGVLLADFLSERLNLQTNGTLKSNTRRSKFHMMEALKANNIPCVKYLKTNDPIEAINWSKEHTILPVIVKPLDSASSDDVYLCNTDEEIHQAADKILKKKNMMGSTNNEFLVQEYLKGTEYVVNTVSANGRHYVTDMWVCKKRTIDNRVIYDKEELIQSTGLIQNLLCNYIFLVLDALGIKWGPAHSELILTDHGPILLETGARIGGAVLPTIHNACIGHNQVSLAIDAYEKPESIFKKTTKAYSIHKHLFVVMLISNNEGVIKHMPLLDEIKKLSTIGFTRFKKKIGDKLAKTRDLSTSPGTVYMMCEDKDKLENEYQELLALAENGFIVE